MCRGAFNYNTVHNCLFLSRRMSSVFIKRIMEFWFRDLSETVALKPEHMSLWFGGASDERIKYVLLRQERV